MKYIGLLNALCFSVMLGLLMANPTKIDLLGILALGLTGSAAIVGLMASSFKK